MSFSSGSSANPKPVIAVCGARGKQGGAVLRALVEDNVFSLRAITRKAKTSPELIYLLGLPNTEIIQADCDDSESLLRAFEGCYGVFAMTDYFESRINEEAQGRRIVDAAKASGVKHIVWSSAPSTDGKVQIYDGKAAVAEYVKSSGVPYTIINVATYFDSLFYLFRKSSSALFRFTSPYPTHSPMPAIDVSDFGAWVAAVFLDPEEWIGKVLSPVNEWITPHGLVEGFREAFSEEEPIEVEVQFNLNLEEFRALPSTEPALLGLKSNMEFFLENTDIWSTDLGKQLQPELKTWKDYCFQRHDDMHDSFFGSQTPLFGEDQIIEAVAAETETEETDDGVEEIAQSGTVTPIGGRARSQSTIKVDVTVVEESDKEGDK